VPLARAETPQPHEQRHTSEKGDGRWLRHRDDGERHVIAGQNGMVSDDAGHVFATITRLNADAGSEELMNDPSQTYEVQIRESYNLGIFLATKKHRLLHLA
jgi:hypothetical protein